MTVLLLLLGAALLVVGAELLVRGSSRIAVGVGISPLVVGLTVVALGTSSPELAVSLQAAFDGQPDIALGNVLGSNIFNILLILGASAAIAPLVVSRQLVRLDVPIMVGSSFLLFLLALDGRLSRLDGILLFSIIVTYTVYLIRRSRQESAAMREAARAAGVPLPGSQRWYIDVAIALAGLALLVLGARWLVQAAVAVATALGVSELIIGLTVIAAGTSLPEAATSVLASIRGERDIAVGNAVGSNLFNILAIVGLTAIVAPDGIRVAASALTFDFPVMVAVAVACLPIFLTGHRINRWEGLLFLGYYVAYTGYLLLAAAQHDALEEYGFVMRWFVIPLTVVTLGVQIMRELKQRRARRVRASASKRPRPL